MNAPTQLTIPPRMRRLLRALAVLPLVAWLPSVSEAAWQVISAEPGKRIEIDRASIRQDETGKSVAQGRIVLEKPIVDPKTSSSYRIVEAVNRYDCASRSYTTLKRSYFKEEGSLLREEEVKIQVEMPVRTGMLDDKLLREVCRPKAGAEAAAAASKVADKVNQVTGELRKANEALLAKDVRKAHLEPASTSQAATETKPARQAAAITSPSEVRTPAHKTHAAANRANALRHDTHWSYEGEKGPDNWGRLRPDYAACAYGRRQSPIDIRDGFRVDLEPIVFAYRPSPFRVVDNGHTIQVEVSGSGISVLGKSYELVQFHFHRPSEERVNDRLSEMVAHLVHKADDGKLAVVAILFEKGAENPVIQTVWNNLPLEKNQYVSPPGISIDVAAFLPADRGYYTYMGSLTTPPCTEGVLWLVLKQPQPISAEQLAIFARLYPHNARPVQPSFGRMIKESR